MLEVMLALKDVGFCAAIFIPGNIYHYTFPPELRVKDSQKYNSGLLLSSFTFWLLSKVQPSKLSHCKCVKPVQF